MQEQSSQKLLHRFRMAGIAEGISFLVLLLIAMPLKYFFNLPQAVKLFGWVHGLLFVGFLWLAFDVMGTLKKPFSWMLKAFAAAIIPLGTFYFDRQWKKEEKLLQN